MKLRLHSTQVVVEVEVWVELGNIKNAQNGQKCTIMKNMQNCKNWKLKNAINAKMHKNGKDVKL